MTQNDLFCTKDSIGISAAQQLEMGVRKLQLLRLSGLLLLPCGAQINVAQHRRCVTKLISAFSVLGWDICVAPGSVLESLPKSGSTAAARSDL